MVERNLKFRYLRDNTRRPYGLVVVDTKSGDIGWSFCHKDDRFVKAKARDIAVGRMLVGSCAKMPREIEKEVADVKTWLSKKVVSV